MARIGISKSYLTGLADVTPWFTLLKQFIVDAGFTIITNTATRIEFMPAGTTPAANTNDDTPHWTLYQTGTTQIHAAALHGLAWDDVNVRSGVPVSVVQAPATYFDEDLGEEATAALKFWAAADGREGWFWIASMQDRWDNDLWGTADGYHRIVCGTRARRLAADMTAGLAARYGVFSHAGVFAPAYLYSQAGTVLQGISAAQLKWWSPISAGGFGTARHVGSPLPISAAPCYPALETSGVSPALFGDLEDVMVCTDGYAHLGTTIPGWVTIKSFFSVDVPLALRAPAAFTPV